MRIVYRTMALLLALCLCLPVTARAAGTVDFSVESVAASDGTARVRILMKNSSGVVSIRLRIAYDASKLTLTGAEEGDLAGVSFGPTTGNPFTLSWMDAIHPDVTGDAVVATLVFSVKEGASGSAALSISCDADDIFDGNFDNVPYTLSGGSVTVEPAQSAQIVSMTRISGEAAAVISCADASASVYCAAYDSEGRMLGVSIQGVRVGENSYTFQTGSAARVRVFVLKNAIPLCASLAK